MVLRNSFMQKYADSQRSELRYHAEAEEMRWFLIRQNMRKYIHYRWNIFFHSDFSRMYPGRHYNACVGQKIPVY